MGRTLKRLATTDEKEADLLRIFGDSTRLSIIRYLLAHEGTVTVQDIAAHVDRLQPTVSNHLRQLRQGELLSECPQTKDRRKVFYVIRRDRVREAMRALDNLLAGRE